MYRGATSLLTALLAILFAFGALVSVRWPSLIMAGGLIGSGELENGLGEINWRELGVMYGGPYFLAAACFYFSALGTANRRHGSFTWFLAGCGIGFPMAFIVDFEAGWWRNPSLGELTLMNAAALAILLAWAIWDLRQRTEAAKRKAVINQQKAEQQPRKAQRPRGPVPAAIQRQRQMFAEQGRKQLAKERRRNR